MGKLKTTQFYVIDPCGDEHKLRETFVIEVPRELSYLVFRILKNLGIPKSKIVYYNFDNVDDLPF